MGFLKDFKKFAMRGNVIDMAVGVVIGGAFGKIVTSLVSDIIMPLIGLATGNIAFTDWKYVFSEAVVDAETGVELVAENALRYGNLIQLVIDFIIIAFCIFVVLRIMNKFKKKEEEAAPPAPPAPTKTELLLEEIRDMMKQNSEVATKDEQQE